MGLYDYNARFYDPNVARFISADTLIPHPTNPQSFNRYSYTRNNPINFTDPSGHRECGASDDCSDPIAHEIIQPPPQVTRLWIDAELVEEIQLYGNTNTAFKNETGSSSYAYSQGFHGGLDLMADPGTEVFAGIKGRVYWVEDGAYKPNYVVIEIAPNTYIVLGHLGDVQVNVGDVVTADTLVGTVANRDDIDHLHVEFWTGPGDNIRPRTIEPPYQYMSPEVKAQFLGLMTNMNERDNRITFHSRSDGKWGLIHDQPELIYNGSNLNEGQPGYVTP